MEKSKLLATEWFAAATTRTTNSLFKSLAGRTRPDSSDTRSFPSGHTSSAAVQSQLAVFNTQTLPVSGVNTLAVGTSWARIEAGKHYHPTFWQVGL